METLSEPAAINDDSMPSSIISLPLKQLFDFHLEGAQLFRSYYTVVRRHKRQLKINFIVFVDEMGSFYQSSSSPYVDAVQIYFY